VFQHGDERDDEKPTGPVRPFEVKITPETCEIGLSVAWRITGRVKAPLEFSRPVVDFQSIIHGDEPTSESVRVASNVPAKTLWIDHGGRLAYVKVVPCGADCFSLELLPRAQVPGRFDFDIFVRPAGGDTQVPAKRIRLRGEILNEIEFVRDHVYLGARPINQVVEESVCLRSRKGMSCIVEKVDGIPDDTTLRFPSKESALGIQLRLRQEVAQLGHQEVRALVTARVAGKLCSAPLVISYYGLPD
jgi:hypothetical protein